MGTRSLTCVVKDGKFKLAQYSQWDGYPIGQGQVIVEFILNAFNKRKFLKNLKSITTLDQKGWDAVWVDCGADINVEVFPSKVHEKFKEKYPQLTRNFGAEILDYIQKTDNPILVKHISMDLEFAADSLMCEWAYVLDMDKNILEIYKGFNQEPIKRGYRFYKFNNLKKGNPVSDEYYPVKLLKKIPFKKLTISTMKDLEKEIFKE